MKTKNILEELMEFYTSLPNDYNTAELYKLIRMMTNDKIDLKGVIQFVTKKIAYEKSPQNNRSTTREKNIKFWEYVLNLFISHLKGV